MYFGCFWRLECIGRVLEAKYGLVYYNLGCFGAKIGPKWGQKWLFWSSMASFWLNEVLVVCFLDVFGV